MMPPQNDQIQNLESNPRISPIESIPLCVLSRLYPSSSSSVATSGEEEQILWANLTHRLFPLDPSTLDSILNPCGSHKLKVAGATAVPPTMNRSRPDGEVPVAERLAGIYWRSILLRWW
ncbi:unnamed protein product [Linum trigynum]|uniref:Uncharacterized protein n=1 Tax=Linum trigynum TaxID=586398 RepID=A0AAV2GB05_9ROSI